MASGRIPANPEGPGHFRDPVQPAREPRPSDLGSPAARFYIAEKHQPAADSGLVMTVVRAQSWESLKSLALALLGPLSHELGICYGLAQGGGGVIAGLLDFLQMIVLEGMYQKIHGPLGTSSWNPIDRAESRALDYVLHSHLETAHREFRQLMDELRLIVTNPREFFGNAWNSEKNEYSQKWQRYKWLMGHRSIANQFESGRMEGQVLLEVALLLATVIDGVGLALKGGKALGELPALARLARGVSKEEAEAVLAARRMESLRAGAGTVDEAAAESGSSGARASAADGGGSKGGSASGSAIASAIAAAPAGSAERGALVDEFAKISTHSQEPANRVVLGKWSEGGGYIADAKASGGVWYETPDGSYKVIGKEAAWDTNEAFLKQQMEAGTPKLEFVGIDVDSELTAYEGKPDSEVPMRIREMRYLSKNAENYGYTREGNSFINDAIPKD